MVDWNSYMFFLWQEGGLSSFNLRHSFSRLKPGHRNQVYRKRRLSACTPLAQRVNQHKEALASTSLISRTLSRKELKIKIIFNLQKNDPVISELQSRGRRNKVWQFHYLVAFLSHGLQKEKASSFRLWESTDYTTALYKGLKGCSRWFSLQFAGSECEAAVGDGPYETGPWASLSWAKPCRAWHRERCWWVTHIRSLRSELRVVWDASAKGRRLGWEGRVKEGESHTQCIQRSRRREAKKKSLDSCGQRLLQLYRAGLDITWD